MLGEFAPILRAAKLDGRYRYENNNNDRERRMTMRMMLLSSPPHLAMN